MSSALLRHALLKNNHNSSIHLFNFFCAPSKVKMDLILGANEKDHPHCPHGPTFLFKKTDAKRKTSRKFFGCSANRDRKFCQFFHWADDPITQEKQKTWKSVALHHLNSLALSDIRKRQIQLANCKPETRLKYCRKCSLILFPDEWERHTGHGSLDNVPFERRMKPTTFITPLEEKKTNAQYFFSDKCSEFIVETLKTFKIKRVLCIGTPRILEQILSKNRNHLMDCLLMDIDHRYAQFYSEKNFILYNLFNHHFFEGHSAQLSFEEFVTSEDSLALVIDPPFGGLISAIARTIHKITNVCGQKEIPILLFFPYFNEDRIKQEIPVLKMLDYKVNYTNHKKFKEGGMKQGSVVRIFTNMDPAKFVLPADEGYRLCPICQRFVSLENTHCPDCNACTSKDGRPFKHCKKCERCFKVSWEHCETCNRCALPNHPCTTMEEDNVNQHIHKGFPKKPKRKKLNVEKLNL